MTWSPFLTLATPGPTSTTIPAPSWPRMAGNRPSGSAPVKREVVGVTDAGGFHLDKDFAGFRPVEIHVQDRQWLAFFECNGGARFHSDFLAMELVTLYRDDSAFLDCERKPPLLECERLVAKQRPPPTGESRDVSAIVGGDAVEVVNGGDYLRGNPMTFRGHAQQHFEQLDRSLSVDGRPGTLEPRQHFWVAREAALDRLDDCFTPFRALEPPG